MKTILSILLFFPLFAGSVAAQPVTLSLEKTIAIAADSSLEAFRSQNMYLAGFWQFRTYRAGRLPSLELSLTPAQYYHDITRRYDSGEDIDVYRKQQYYYAYGMLSVEQNFDLLGGKFFLDTDMGYMRNFGANAYTQYTAVPIRFGYSQDLLGYNPFKWERKIEPLKYEKVKKEFLYNVEQISETATEYFFQLAMAQAEYDLAKDNVASTDTLYRTGEQRYRIASITRADLLTLKLDAVNARNTLQNADIALKRAMFGLASFLNFDKTAEIRLQLPGKPVEMTISVDDALARARENNPKFLNLRQQILEAEQTVDKTRRESLFNASFRASIGFNQAAERFSDVYLDPMRQDVVSISITIPLIDWGVRKGRYNIARNTLNVARISTRQEELALEEDLIMTVGDFNIRQRLIASADEALELAEMAFSETRQRFIIGKADINSLTLSLNRQQEARRNYISALKNYWLSYYKIRKLTLFDFIHKTSLSTIFEL
ncbi:MAG: TolC family protein [Tannerella sp.]|jgi:outer membrane protein TolC|nr:TolC family protein [Tannerella sp.]